MGLGHHGVEVVTFGNALDHQLLDLGLQVGVGALQRTHLEEGTEDEMSFSERQTRPTDAEPLVSRPYPGSWPDGCSGSAWPPCR